MVTHSSVLAWRIPGTGKPGGLPSRGSHRVRHDWSNLTSQLKCIDLIFFWKVIICLWTNIKLMFFGYGMYNVSFYYSYNRKWSILNLDIEILTTQAYGFFHPYHQAILWHQLDILWLNYIWHHLPRDSLSSQRLSPTKVSPNPHFWCQLHVQVVTCASDLPVIDWRS